MNLVNRLVFLLRALLVVLFAVLVVFQFLSFPGQFAYQAQQDPGFAGLRWPLTVFVFLELLCVQVVIVAIWRLLGLVRTDRIFSRQAFGWVDAIVAALGAGWLMFAGLSAWLVLAYADDPGTPMLLFALVIVGAVVTLLMVVMRALLHRATRLNTELEGVI